MRIPLTLKKGDQVIIVATAGIVPKEKIESAIKILESWDLIVEIGQHCLKESGYFAGSDAERLSDLQKALDNPNYKAIFCARGGYGTTRIIDHLEFTSFLKKPKWICGFSDLTAILSHLNRLEVEAVHSVMPIVFDQHLKSTESLKKLLFNESYKIEAEAHSLNVLGEVNAPLIGGNLSILSHIIGTDSDVNWDNKILLIEDLNEEKYQIDRIFVQLKRAGKINKIKALLVGQMTNMKDSSSRFKKNIEEIILEHFRPLNIPIAFNIPVGHQEENFALPFGRNVELMIDSSGTNIKLKPI